MNPSDHSSETIPATGDVEPSVNQASTEGLLQPDERQFLQEYRGKILAAIQSNQQEGNGNAEIKARIAAIQGEIEELEARLDPLNDAEFQTLELQVSSKKRQMALLEEKLESDSNKRSIPLAFGGLRPTLYSCLERQRIASHERFIDLLSGYFTSRKTAEYVSGLSEKNSLFDRFIRAQVCLCYECTEREALLLVKTIDNLLAGKELFQFPPQ